MLTEADLPEDIDALRALVLEQSRMLAEAHASKDAQVAELAVAKSEGGDNWAVIATLNENCKLSGINPHDWLTRTLVALANGHPANRLAELMPWIAVP